MYVGKYTVQAKSEHEKICPLKFFKSTTLLFFNNDSFVIKCNLSILLSFVRVPHIQLEAQDKTDSKSN